MGYGLILLILGAIWGHDLSAQAPEKSVSHSMVIIDTATNPATANPASINASFTENTDAIPAMSKVAVIIFLITLMVATVWKIHRLARRC